MLQIVSMGLFTVLVPILVGFDNYGYYVSVFAVPGFLVALIETSLLVDSKNSIVKIQVYIFLLASIIVNFILFGAQGFFLTVLLFSTLITRTIVYVSIVRLSISKFKKVYFRTEVCSLFVFLIAFSLLTLFSEGYFVEHLTFILFFVLNVSFSMFGCYFIFRVNKYNKDGFKIISVEISNSKSISFKSLFKLANFRLFEDFIFTFSPLLLSMNGGNQVAGIYKFYTSILKLGIKVYPVRYETFLDMVDSLRNNTMRKILYVNFSLSLIFIFISCSIFYILAWKSNITIELNYSFYSFVCLFPFVGFVVSAFPSEINRNVNLPYILTVTIVILSIASQIAQDVYGYVVSFFIMLYFCWFYFNMSRLQSFRNNYE